VSLPVFRVSATLQSKAMAAIESQVESMRTWDRSFSERCLRQKAAFQKAATSSSSSPEDIAKAANDAIQAVQTIFEGLKAIIQAARSEISAIEALQKSAENSSIRQTQKQAARTANREAWNRWAFARGNHQDRSSDPRVGAVPH